MKRIAVALGLFAIAAVAFACPDGSKEAQAGTIGSKLADAQQMSRAPTTTPAPKAVVAASKEAKTVAPTTAAADSAKKLAPGG